MMKKTILSKKELEILEKIIVKYGYIVSSHDIKGLLSNYSYDEVNQEIKFLVNRGWLIRIKRSYYVVANLESHNFSNISPLIISRIFVPDSYISFEFSLNYHGLFDQLPNRVVAVTTLKSKRYNFQNIEYKFVKAKSEMIFGFEEVEIDQQIARVASVEKAILDFLHFRKDIYTIDLIIEKLKEVKDDISYSKLADYAAVYPVALKRRLGFILDIIGINSVELNKAVRKIPGFVKLTKNSNIFNAKWRIYYEDRFIK